MRGTRGTAAALACAAALAWAPAATASPLTDCVARHNTPSSADYCVLMYGPTSTVTSTKTTTVTTTKTDTEFITVESEIDAAAWFWFATFLAVAAALGVGGTLAWQRRAAKPAHAGRASFVKASPQPHAAPFVNAAPQPPPFPGQGGYAAPPAYNAPPQSAPSGTFAKPAAADRADADPFGL